MLNINGKNDSSYRYKMPAVKSTVKGNGNGIFTVINNIDDISKSLNHPPILLLKFLSSSFGSIQNEEKMSITGNYSETQIQDTLQVYINKFVICPACSIPETVPQIKKESKKNILLELKCSACGKTSTILCNNKNEEKTKDFIISFLNKNEWIIQNKGNIIINNNIENDIFD